MNDHTHISTASVTFLQLTDLVSENAMLKGKMSTMKEHCQSAELETKASRETIMRLVSESEREQRSANNFTRDVENCRMVGTYELGLVIIWNKRLNRH